MKYIVCEKPGEFILKEKEAPVRKAGEALLKINKVGICGTDLHAYSGNQAFFTYPRILGHELASEVLEIDENAKGIKAGDKVVVMPYVSCGECIACRNGKTNCCTNIRVLGVHADGGMQEQITVPANILLPANNLSNDQMAIVEPLAIGAHAIRRADIKAGETVVVVGCGPIGIGIMKLAQIAGAKVIALDMNEDRLKYAKENIGVDYVVNVSNDPVKQIEEITNGDLATAVFDASGNKFALEACPDYMAHGGRFVLVGLSKGELTYTHPKVHAKEMTLMCSRNATTEDFKHVISVLDQFPTESFITHSVPFTEMIANFDSWLKPETGVIKATVNFN
ncbi:zinc-binding alcohol dehydrogenase family protein [Algibacter amylolyticus]|uniref:Zinc-binding alcohol dehydrogenase family protein n=1 Tax=Algibacter amylolyticus TaxID=1608400 RepID=A0A5M7B881_9FLAO|nr:zinc-binding alcohol dehydrogenase family protein [Algibacter amylolyticus]KAA5823784.1 zinc-binding alcohol dehydrogenase family protein [Algibacter amylolyticus]MBB5267957.1 2-desacetyl-2-hydroxyethyl bacteriochlorophyllide A dehydrogenase [Algibacter amylolyticus]TSJ74272.1 zinc-binding alcohol dehydrogenase family protein [Algibacter amylolyticus]